jgi:hypothetical protein
MAKPYSPINMRSIDVQFDKAIKEVEEKMGAILAKTAETCLLNVINPDGKDPFKTGSYISSHRVGINKVDTSDTVIYQKGIRTKDVAKGRAYLELKKIKNIKPEDTITISNSVGYSTKYGYSWARNVEYRGWGKTGPYLVYEKAVAKTMAAMPKIVASVRMKTAEDVWAPSKT